MKIRYFIRAIVIDTLNRVQFGVDAPRYGERIWINPEDCVHYIESSDFRDWSSTPVRKMSGRVLTTWPTELQRKLSDNPKLNYCFSHWGKGLTWSEAGAIDFMMEKISTSPSGVSDDCRNREDVVERFELLDRIWNSVRKAERIPTRQELTGTNFRELGGVLVHLGPGGEPIFSGAGCHRFAMAMLLRRPFPAQLGCVHISALKLLPRFRQLCAD